MRKQVGGSEAGASTGRALCRSPSATPSPLLRRQSRQEAGIGRAATLSAPVPLPPPACRERWCAPCAALRCRNASAHSATAARCST